MRSLHLIRRLALLDLLRLRGRTLLRLSTTAPTTLVISALVIAVTISVAIAALLPIALIAGTVVKRQQAGHRIFYLRRVRIRQRPFRELENNIRLVERSGADVIARIAGDDTQQNLVFGQIDESLEG